VDIQERITEIEKKLDTVLSILGHGREKSHAQIQREAEGTVERLRLMAEQRKQRKGAKI
jgi:hypothetical protein